MKKIIVVLACMVCSFFVNTSKAASSPQMTTLSYVAPVTSALQVLDYIEVSVNLELGEITITQYDENGNIKAEITINLYEMTVTYFP